MFVRNKALGEISRHTYMKPIGEGQRSVNETERDVMKGKSLEAKGSPPEENIDVPPILI